METDTTELDLSPDELRKIKSQYNKAKGVLENVLGLQTKFDSIHSKLVLSYEDVTKVADGAKEQFSFLENLKKDADTLLGSIQVNLEKANTNIGRIEEILAQFKTSQAKVGAHETEATNILAEVKNDKTEIEKCKTVAQKKLSEIENQFTQVQEKVTLITDAYKIFFEINKKIEDEESGLEAVYTWAQQQKEEIGKLLGQARADQTMIAEMKVTSATDVENIANQKKDVEGYRKEIEKIYGYINGQGLAHSFSERQKKLKWPLILWSIALFSSTVLVSLALWRVFLELPIDTVTGKRIFDPASLFYRLSFVSPIILIFIVALRQYSRERRLLESYAFKAATAKALESYTAILARGFPEDKFRHRILAFVLHAMMGIYRHPNNEINKVDDDKEWSDKLGEVFERVSNPVVNSVKSVAEAVIPSTK